MTRHRFDRYVLLRRIHTTPLFQSYEASHPRHPGRFEVQLWNGVRQAPDVVAAVERDVTTVVSMRHPSLLPVREFTSLPDGTSIVVSELPQGRTLKAWLDAGRPITPGSAVKLIAALADALAAAHAREVTHGAVIAENVYLVGSDDGAIDLPKLQGCGLGRLRGAGSVAGPSASTPGAVSEEAVSSPGTPSWQDDLAQLAQLAQRLLIASQGVGPGLAGAGALAPAITMILSRAQDPTSEQPFESPTEFAVALEMAATSALQRPAKSRRRASVGKALFRRNTARVTLGLANASLVAAVLVVMEVRFGFSPLDHLETLTAWSLPAQDRDTVALATASSPMPSAAIVVEAPTVSTGGFPLQYPAGVRRAISGGEGTIAAISQSKSTGSPTLPSNQRPRSRALRGFVWSPSAQQLVPADRGNPPPRRNQEVRPAPIEVSRTGLRKEAPFSRSAIGASSGLRSARVLDGAPERDANDPPAGQGREDFEPDGGGSPSMVGRSESAIGDPTRGAAPLANAEAPLD